MFSLNSWTPYILWPPTKNLEHRYDQWMTVYLLSVCPLPLAFNSSSHPSRLLRLSAVVCLFTPSEFSSSHTDDFYCMSLAEIKRGRQEGALRAGRKNCILWERERALKRRIYPLEISLSVLDPVLKMKCWYSRGASLEDRCLPFPVRHPERIKITFICQTHSMW